MKHLDAVLFGRRVPDPDRSGGDVCLHPDDRDADRLSGPGAVLFLILKILAVLPVRRRPKG